jgi:hypothetical protein
MYKYWVGYYQIGGVVPPPDLGGARNRTGTTRGESQKKSAHTRSESPRAPLRPAGQSGKERKIAQRSW